MALRDEKKGEIEEGEIEEDSNAFSNAEFLRAQVTLLLSPLLPPFIIPLSLCILLLSFLSLFLPFLFLSIFLPLLPMLVTEILRNFARPEFQYTPRYNTRYIKFNIYIVHT